MREYTDARCPACGAVFTGSREPGADDYCAGEEKRVVLEPVEDSDETADETDAND